MSTIELTAPVSRDTDDADPFARLQRRTLATLIATQVTGGLGLASAVTVGSLIAAELGGAGAAGLPLAASVAGTATVAYPLSLVMRRVGRRRGLRLGWFAGAVGAVVAVGAVLIGSLPALLAGMLLFGGAEAASSGARFAAADLAPQSRRGGAIGVVVSSTAITATIGPLMVGPATSAAAAAGLPTLAGPFVVSALAFGLAGAVLTAALRPDPLVIAAGMSGDDARSGWTPRPTHIRLLLRSGEVRLGIAAVVTANLTMLALMTATPLHVAGEHAGAHGVGDIGVIISLHVAGMFAPAPLTGRLGDRIGHRLVVRVGALLLALAGILAVGTVAGGVGRLAFALVLLGVGWNFAFIGGSSMITTALDARERPRVQGLADMAMGVAGMLGAAGSGVVVAWAGFAGLGVACAVFGTALLVAASLLGTTRAATVREARAH